MELKDQLKQVESDLAAENAKGAEKNPTVVSQLEAQQADLLKQIMDEKQTTLAGIPTMSLADLQTMNDKLLSEEPLDTELLQPVQARIAELEQTKAHVDRVSQVATDYYSVIDNLDLGEGVTLRKLITNPALYQLATIGLKNAFAAQVEPLSKQIAELQTTNADQAKSNDDLRSKLAKLADENADLANQASTEKLNRQQAEMYRDNAAAQIDELNGIIKQKNGHIEDLQGQIALGVRDQIKVVNTEEEEKQKAEALAEYKRQYTVYEEQPADFKRSKFTAKRAYDDSAVEYTNLEKPSYTVIDTNAVSQFRTQYPAPVQADNHADSTLDQPVPASIEPPAVEATQFPATAEVPNGSQVGQGDAGQAGTVAAEEAGTVTREEFEALKADVEVLKRRQGMVA